MGTESVCQAHRAVLSEDLADLAQVSGVAFFQKLVECMSARFQADLVTIGELRVMETERINVLASVFDGLSLGEFEYEACVTPCFDVLTSGDTKVVLSDVQDAYPQDEMFIEEGVQSYVGLALLDSSGEAQGLIQAAWRRTISEEEAASTLEVMRFFQDRLNSELATLQEVSVLEVVARGPRETTPQDAFRLLCTQIQRVMKVRVAFIAECLDDDESCFRILSYCYEGQIIDEVEGRIMPFEGSPCENLKASEQFFVPSGLQKSFPEVTSFKEQNLHAYLGLAVKSAEGTILGHIAVQHDKAIPKRSLEAKLMFLFADRVGLELRRHKAETRRLRSEASLALKRKTESLGLLTRSIAAEFSTQLEMMRGHIDTAQACLDDQIVAQQHLQAVQDGIESSRALVGQILDFSKGQDEFDPVSLELNKVISEASTQLSDTLTEGRTFKLDLAAGLPRVNMDKAQTRQMLLNVMANALEAVEVQGSEVAVETRSQTLLQRDRDGFLNDGSKLPDRCIVLEVTDNGVGMSPDTVERIFDPFFSTKPERRGIGLTTVLGILDRHGGAVRIDSDEGVGTSVRIYLPPCREGEAPLAAEQRATEKGRSTARRMLVIDDEASVQKAVGGLLQLRGCQVDLADGPDEARALVCENGPYLCVVIGAQKTTRGGWNTLAALREYQPNLPCVMISGQYSGGSVAEGDLPDVTVLDKPFSKEKLYRAVFA